jgi:hypothetical protein
MGTQRQSKNIRRVIRKERNKVISSYVSKNWSSVVASSVMLIRTFKFSTRLKIAVQILFSAKRNKQADAEQG